MLGIETSQVLRLNCTLLTASQKKPRRGESYSEVTRKSHTSQNKCRISPSQ